MEYSSAPAHSIRPLSPVEQTGATLNQDRHGDGGNRAGDHARERGLSDEEAGVTRAVASADYPVEAHAPENQPVRGKSNVPSHQRVSPAPTASHRRHTTGSLIQPRNNRRRSSLLKELSDAVRESMPGAVDDAADSGGTADNGDEDDIAKTFDALLKHACKSKLTSTAACNAVITTWRREKLSDVEDVRVLLFFDDVLPSVVSRLVLFEETNRVAQKRTVFWAVALTFFDTVSDYSACLVLFIEGSAYAKPMLAVLLMSMVSQSLVAQFATREGPIVTLGALLGFKPIIDGIHIIFDIPPRSGALSSLAAFGYTRSVETSTESIPFAVMQILALVERRSVAQVHRSVERDLPSPSR